MLFNSIDFAVFLPIVFVIYWFVLNDNIKAQNIFLILVSYVFYGWWDWRFLTLIFSSSLVDYCVGMYLSRAETNKKRRSLLLLSIFVNLGFLGFFKYYNFFINSFVETFTFLGFSMHAQGLQIILPVGISFYTQLFHRYIQEEIAAYRRYYIVFCFCIFFSSTGCRAYRTRIKSVDSISSKKSICIRKIGRRDAADPMGLI